MIFQVKDLMDEALRKTQQKERRPDHGELMIQMDKAAKELIDTGYDRRYPKLFDDVANYVALWRMGFANTGYMMMGNTVCGKTEAARRLSALLQVQFVTTSELLMAFGTEEYYRMVRQPDFFSNEPGPLIIDEIGTEPRPFMHFGTKYNVLADVLQERYDAFKFYGAKTIITTNLNFDELEEAYGDRVESRCWEMFRAKQYRNDDFRKVKR